jgi:hypothetical protein
LALSDVFIAQLERFTKVTLKGEDPHGLSAIEPETYRDRFVNHIKDIIDLDEVPVLGSAPTMLVRAGGSME